MARGSPPGGQRAADHEPCRAGHDGADFGGLVRVLAAGATSRLKCKRRHSGAVCVVLQSRRDKAGIRVVESLVTPDRAHLVARTGAAVKMICLVSSANNLWSIHCIFSDLWRDFDGVGPSNAA